MPFQPQSVSWPGTRALVLVHGAGDYKKGDYNRLLSALEGAIAATQWKKVAVYTVFYDLLNDWVVEKTQAAVLLGRLVDRLKFHFDSTTLGQVAAESVGDILWPILELDARAALRDAVLAQLQRVVLDGDQAGVPRREQKISIICHSLGCFHTYEALSAAAGDPRFRLQPVADAVQFDNVVMMASPVQLIRSVAGWLGRLIPDPDTLYCLRGTHLDLMGMSNLAGRFVPSTRRLVSVTGVLDPVGGYVFRRRLDWAYMGIHGQESVIDDQTALNIPDETSLVTILSSALKSKKGLPFTANNPHDWIGYVDRNARLVKECVLS